MYKRQAVGPELGVKASGGVRDAAFAKEVIEAGACLLYTSSVLTKNRVQSKIFFVKEDNGQIFFEELLFCFIEYLFCKAKI